MHRCRLLRGEAEERGPLTRDELSRLRAQVDAWLEEESPSAALELGGSMLHIRAALDMLRQSCRAGPGHPSNGKLLGGGSGAAAPESGQAEQLRKLKLQVCQPCRQAGLPCRHSRHAPAPGPGGQAISTRETLACRCSSGTMKSTFWSPC